MIESCFLFDSETFLNYFESKQKCVEFLTKIIKQLELIDGSGHLYAHYQDLLIKIQD